MRVYKPAAALAAGAALFLSTPIAGQTTKQSSVDPNAIRQGAILFRQECVFCHGVGARGGARGPDLTIGSWNHGGSDADLARTITNGIPATNMPANRLTSDEVRQVVAYLRSRQQPPAAPSTGDTHRGEALFFGAARCSSCHIVNGRGGRLGPELSHIGSARPRTYLVESIREPDRQLSENCGASGMTCDTITVVARDGKTFSGVPIDEDTFTIQLMDRAETIRAFDKKSVKSFRHESKSMMPAYNVQMLDEAGLEDILAYLASLRAATPAPEKEESHENR